MGLDDALLALTLLAIEPGLKGVLIAGAPGTGKSALARAARALWPAGTPFVEAPLGVTMDRLIGGIDVERTLEAGRPVAAPGLLAAAHGGVLYVDEINLLAPELANVLCHTLASGQVRLEREGISQTSPAEFVLIGTFNPAEGPVAPALLDRAAFITPVTTLRDVPTRAFIAANAIGRPRGSPLPMPPDVINMVGVGREVLPQVRMPANALKELCAAATALQALSNRAEVFAVRCAKANAALNARAPITQSDIDLAVRLVLSPRATHRMEIVKAGADQSPSETPSPREQSEGRSADAPKKRERGEGSQSRDQADVKPMAESGEAAPLGLLREPIKAEGGTAGGKRGQGLNTRRGRHIRSLPGRPGQGQLALVDTLKAAALNRRATIGEKGRVIVRREDVRIKQFRQRTGLLVVFAVDASGSMALNRINMAKAAAISLLQSAYVHRDKIALISFRRDRAEIILSPGGGVAKARRALEGLPTGGRTPLSAALVEVMNMAGEKACHLQVAGTVLVLITDARTNQPLRPAPQGGDRRAVAREEVERLAKQLGPRLAGAVMIDTRRIFVAGGSGQELAGWLGARYFYLPTVSAAQITTTVQGEVAKIR
ncbi:MAG: VWA domain-containing protein [Chloroflexi bacterium]|nr:VWA domain-containing protein [Chloroflexota bacterium]